AVADQLAVFWPNQNDRGTHFNISGAALTASSKNRDETVALLEYMVSQEAQEWYAEVNNEYPVVAGVEPSNVLKAFGTAKSDDVALSKLGELNQEALRLMDRAGWK
ncbi:MAG: Fe(3+) ABC transporter substrate-binding protein, partial [Marinobacterium sp.]